jgi:Tat protein translocase TatB subunit
VRVFGISGTELFFIVVFALIIFGPDKLPQMARTVGRFMREFKRAQENVETLLKAELYSTEKSQAPPTPADSASKTEGSDALASASFGDDIDEEEEEE